MGGLDAGPVEQAGHDHAAWEKRIDAIRGLLTKRGLITVDEMRRGIEDLGPGAYDELSYYERWLSSVTNVMLEKGRSEEHTSELQSLMRISYAVFCLKKKKTHT